MADRSKPRLVQETPCGDYLFAWEEYWTEDNDGFCSTDFLWEKHSRLKVLDAEKKEVAVFDFDSGQREKELSAENRLVHALYWPSYQTRRTLTIHADDLTITNDIVEHNI